jgi:hypothetical protein
MSEMVCRQVAFFNNKNIFLSRFSFRLSTIICLCQVLGRINESRFLPDKEFLQTTISLLQLIRFVHVALRVGVGADPKKKVQGFILWNACRDYLIWK